MLRHSLTFLGAAVVAAAAHAQHFRTPPPVTPAPNLALGEPVALDAEPVTSFGAATLDGWLYTLGGYTGVPHQYNKDDQSDAFRRFNLRSPDHVETLPNDLRIQSASLESHSGRVIRVGGLVIENGRGEERRLRSIAEVAAVDPHGGVWTALPALPAPRSSHDTAVIDGVLYVVGGWTLDDARAVREWRPEIHALDLDAPDAAWTAIPASFTRRAIAAVGLDGRLVVLGGMTVESEHARSVDVYDPATDEWTSGPDFPVGAFGVAATVAGDQVVASAGSGEVFAWRPGEPAWRRVGALTFPRFFHQLATTPGGDVLALGGISKGVRPRHIERIALDGQAPAEPIVTTWTLPFPGRAENRQGALRDGRRLYAFGGNTSTNQHDFAPENFLAEGWTLDLARLEWAPAPAYPVARQSMVTLVREGGAGVAIGGFGHDGEVARTHPEGFRFDFDEGAWAEGHALPVSRTQFGLVEHEGRLWVFGGLNYDPRRPEGDHFRHPLPTLVESDSAGGFVESGHELPRPRRAFGSAVLDGKVYLVGGMREGFQPVEGVDVFDLEHGAWTTAASPAQARVNPELVALGGRLFLAAGSSPQPDGGVAPDPRLDMYDPATDTWTTILDALPMHPGHLRMFAHRGRLLLYSVHTERHDATNLALIDVSGFLRAGDDSVAEVRETR